MSDLKKVEFFLLRYVPDAIKDEFINIGVVVMDGGAAQVRFTQDWRRVRCLDPGADIEMLQGLEVELRRRLAQAGPDRDRILKLLNESFSNTLQLSTPKSCLAASAAEEADKLVEMYLETHRRAARREAGNRQVILGHMRDAFEQAGVWKLMRHQIAVAQYTRPGDPLRLDCGYRPNGVIKMFHAVSLATDVDSAKVLAFSFPQIAEGIRRVEHADALLTAVVEDDLPRDDDAIAFALDTFARTQIAVAPVAELPQLAETARREMKL
jgi:hypothetical protein